MPVWKKPNWTAPPEYNHTLDFRISQPCHHGKQQWWSVLVTLSGSIQDFERKVAELGNPTTGLIVPVAYDHADRRRSFQCQPVSVFMQQSLVRAINADMTAYNVLALQLGAVTPDRFLDPDAQFPPMDPKIVPDGTVLTAVIDDGIGIGHDLFRDSTVSTRISYAAILDAETLHRCPYASVGRVLDATEINSNLSENTFSHLLDEDRFYQQTGQVDPYNDIFSTVALQKSHGTHVMALAVGAQMETAQDTRPILCAELPSRLVEDTTGHDLLPALYLAFHMLAKQAGRYRTADGTPVPVVFNFSYGNGGGPHDGTGQFATLFEDYFGDKPRWSDLPQRAWLTLPAGNNNLRQLHAVAQTGRDIQLDVLPDDKTANEVEIWMPYIDGQIPPMDVEITTPFGQSGSANSIDGRHISLENADGYEIARLSFSYARTPTERGVAVLSINPTAGHDPTPIYAPSGIWTIRIKAEEDILRDTHLWIRRDETLPGSRTGGRQAKFIDPEYQKTGAFGRPLPVDPRDTQSYIRRSVTLSGFATGQSPIVVGAYTGQDKDMSYYSASGPLNHPASAIRRRSIRSGSGRIGG